MNIIAKAQNKVLPLEKLQKESQQKWQGPFFFIQAADTQLGLMDRFGTDGRDGKDYPEANWDREIELCKQSVNIINNMSPKPRFFIICGDLIDAFPDEWPELREQQIRDFKNIYSQLDPEIPLICVCGNHDIGNSPTEEDIVKYRSSFGDDYFSFWHGGVAFLVLNSQFYEDASRVKAMYAAHEAWLEAELLKMSDCKHIVVFQHIPWFVSHPTEEKFYFNVERELREKKLEQFHKAGVSKIFCGHYHRNAGGWYPSEKEKELEVVVTSAIGCQIGPDQHGMRVVKVKEDDITHEYHALTSFPTRIST